MSASPQSIERLEYRPTPRMQREYAEPVPPRSLHRRLTAILDNVEGRCGKYPSVNRFGRYGGRGIKSFLTLNDLRCLWERDSADAMTQPSIDRKDSDGHYTFENCRFIEFEANRKAADHRVTCATCGKKAVGIKNGLCPSCHPGRPCKQCGDAANRPGKQFCRKCDVEVRPCAWCGKPVKREGALRQQTTKNKQWFCSRREHGQWLGTLRTKQRRAA